MFYHNNNINSIRKLNDNDIIKIHSIFKYSKCLFDILIHCHENKFSLNGNFNENDIYLMKKKSVCLKRFF